MERFVSGPPRIHAARAAVASLLRQVREQDALLDALRCRAGVSAEEVERARRALDDEPAEAPPPAAPPLGLLRG